MVQRRTTIKDARESSQAYICPRSDSTTASYLEDNLHLAETLKQKYERTGSLATVEDRVELCTELLSAYDVPVSADPSNVIRCEFMLAEALLDRFTHVGRLIDVDQSIAFLRHLAEGCSASRSLHLDVSMALGSALRMRASRNTVSALDDLRTALQLHRQAFEHPSNMGTGDSQSCLLELAETLLRAFSHTEDIAYLDESIDLLRKAVGLHSTADFRALRLLSEALFQRCKLDEYPQALLEEVEILARESVAACPELHPDRPLALGHFGVVLLTAFDSNGDLGVLKSSQDCLQEALRISDAERPERVFWLLNMSVLLDTRIRRGDEQESHTESSRYAADALRLCSPGHPLRAHCLSRVAGTLSNKFCSTDNICDMEQSVNLYRQAVEAANPALRVYQDHLSNFGFTLLRYAGRTGNKACLHEAIDVFRRAINLPSKNLPPPYLKSNLGLALYQLHEMTGSIEELLEAIDMHEQAVNEGNLKHWMYRSFVVRLSAALHALLKRRRDQASISEVVAVAQRAVDLWPEDDVSRYRPLTHLGRILCDCYDITSDPVYADRAAEALNDALRCAVSEVQQPEVLFALAGLHSLPESPHFNLEKALDCIICALKKGGVSAQLRLKGAVQQLEDVERSLNVQPQDLHLREQMLSAYRLVISLLPRIAYLGFNPRLRLETLARAKDVAVNAASHALCLGLPETALEVLEEGRAVFWAQYLRLRTAFDELPGDLATELSTTAKQLESPNTPEQEMTRLGERFQGLIVRARTLPGHQRFMLHDMYTALSEASARGPVVVLLANKLSSCAIVISQPMGNALHIPLGRMQPSRLETLRQSMDHSNRLQRARSFRALKLSHSSNSSNSDKALDVYSEIWEDVMRPITEALGLKKGRGRDRPRLFLCATGIFSYLPLHAAGHHRKRGAVACSDYFVTSYTPTVSALRRALANFGSPSRADTHIALAAVSIPFQLTPLVFATAEIGAITTVVPSMSILPLQPKLDPGPARLQSTTAEALLGIIPQANILHLASHGIQHRSDPLQSGFVMQNRMLTMSELMPLNLPRAFFAFLSACETAKGDAQQPDQAVHLAAAMLFAGFRSVVGTMWSMGDIDGPSVATKVYSELFAGTDARLDPDAIPYGLNAAADELRAKGIHPSRWATYVHLGV